MMYVDRDGDVVTMASDMDLADAVLIQRLNPLYVTVIVKPMSSVNSQPSPTPAPDMDDNMQTWMITCRGVQQEFA